MTQIPKGSSIQISSLLVGLAGFACAAITLGYYGKPTAADGSLWYFYLLCITAFFIGHMVYFRRWVANRRFANVVQIIRTVAVLSLPVAIVLVPALWGLDTQLPPPTLTAYQIAQSYAFTLYTLAALSLYTKLLTMRNGSGQVRWVEWFYGMLIVAALYLVVRKHMPDWATIAFYIIGGIGVAYLTTRLQWISLVRREDKALVALLLLLVNAINALLVYHYVTERSQYLFSVYDPLPEIIYISSIGFSTMYGLMSFLALLFYFPVSDIVDQQNRELEGLMEISESARQRENVNQVFDRMFNATVRDSGAEAGWLWFKLDHEDAVVKAKNINLTKVNEFRTIIEPLIGKDHNADVLDVAQLQAHETLAPVSNGFRSMLALPLLANDAEVGMLCLFKHQPNGFDAHMANMAKTYVNFALNAYENQQVLEEAIRNEHVMEEYKIARQIQQRLIPAVLSGQNGWYAVTSIEPSKEVGGDFYDSFVIDENRTAIVIGDVSGSGMPAALHMAEIKGIFLSLTAFKLEAKELIIRANNAVSACFEKNRFVSLVYLVIDKKERKFTYIRAGHCPILYYDSQQQDAYYLKDDGLGLGIIRSKHFEGHVNVYEQQYNDNDLILLYTDGVEEALDLAINERYGRERLKRSLLEALRFDGLEKTMKYMLADIKRHVRNNRNLDDMAIILLRFGNNCHQNIHTTKPFAQKPV